MTIEVGEIATGKWSGLPIDESALPRPNNAWEDADETGASAAVHDGKHSEVGEGGQRSSTVVRSYKFQIKSRRWRKTCNWRRCLDSEVGLA